MLSTCSTSPSFTKRHILAAAADSQEAVAHVAVIAHARHFAQIPRRLRLAVVHRVVRFNENQHASQHAHLARHRLLRLLHVLILSAHYNKLEQLNAALELLQAVHLQSLLLVNGPLELLPCACSPCQLVRASTSMPPASRHVCQPSYGLERLLQSNIPARC